MLTTRSDFDAVVVMVMRAKSGSGLDADDEIRI